MAKFPHSTSGREIFVRNHFSRKK